MCVCVYLIIVPEKFKILLLLLFFLICLPLHEQVSAGAVVLTDCVFWVIIYPFLTPEDYRLDFVSIRVTVKARAEQFTLSYTKFDSFCLLTLSFRFNSWGEN